jgi:2-dehydro-3-deoxygluconokinase
MILAFGEVMLRLCPPGFERFRQALPGDLVATFGGGEANVSASLAFYGEAVRYLTALPENPVADALAGAMRGLGVDTSCILRRPGRLGIYYLETGANQRSSQVVYDRAGSSVSLAEADEYDIEAACRGVDWLHITGITPAISREAFEATLAVARRAREAGATVSCDLNYRKKLWRWREQTEPKVLAGECMQQIVEAADVIVGNEEDAADVFGIEAEGTRVEAGEINPDAYTDVARRLVERFPQARLVAITLRESISASHNNWGAMLYDTAADASHFAPLDADGNYRPYPIRSIVDRVGAGDSFCAGLIHALRTDDLKTAPEAVAFAAAASCLKHSIPGDWNYVTESEVRALQGGSASGRVRR